MKSIKARLDTVHRMSSSVLFLHLILLPHPHGFPSFVLDTVSVPVPFPMSPYQNKQGFMKWVYAFVKRLTNDTLLKHSQTKHYLI